MWKLTINLLICQQVPQKAFWLVPCEGCFWPVLDSCARLAFVLPPVVRFVELLALCEVERNGERDERRGFKRHDVGDNSALTVRSPFAGTGCACGAVALVRGFAARCRNCPV